MRLISFFKKLFKKTEVPLTPDQELELREQLRIMQDIERHSGQDSVGNVPRGLPNGWETGIGGKAVEAHTWRDPKLNP
jgi:hypothetical protein